MCQRFTLEKKWNKDQECATKERPCAFISYVSHVAIFNRSCHVRTWIAFKMAMFFFNNTTIYMLYVACCSFTVPEVQSSSSNINDHMTLQSMCSLSVLIFCISCSSFSSSPSTFKVRTHTHTLEGTRTNLSSSAAPFIFCSGCPGCTTCR